MRVATKRWCGNPSAGRNSTCGALQLHELLFIRHVAKYLARRRETRPVQSRCAERVVRRLARAAGGGRGRKELSLA